MNHAPRDRLDVRLICGMTQKCLTTKKLHPEIFFCVFSPGSPFAEMFLGQKQLRMYSFLSSALNLLREMRVGALSVVTP